MLLTSQNTYNQPWPNPRGGFTTKTRPFTPTHIHSSQNHHSATQKHNQPFHLLPPSLPSPPPPSNHQTLIHTQPTSLAVPLNTPKSILHIKTTQKPSPPKLPQARERRQIHSIVWLFILSCWTILGVFSLIFQCLIHVIFVLL